MTRAYIIAGEASGDFLGAQLMRELKTQKPELTFSGIGGPRMAEQGLSSLFPYHELSLMGFVEIVPHLLKLAGRINFTVEDILAKQPDLVITIDSPGFCFRVVKKLREAGCKSKFVHYVAPTVWMYKPERAATCAALFDHLLLLLPFEKPYFEKEGLACTFVGHPIVVETEAGNGAAFREKYQIAPHTTLFSLLPGSRAGEIKRHLPILANTLMALAAHNPDIAIAVAVPKHVMPLVAAYFQTCPLRAIVTASDEDKKNAFAASNLALTKSGTVVLELAKAGTPMIVTHKANPISVWIFRKQMQMKWVSLINILLQNDIVPELLQEQCEPKMLSQAAAALLASPERQQQQTTAFQTALDMLTPPGSETPSKMAAKTILQLL